MNKCINEKPTASSSNYQRCRRHPRGCGREGTLLPPARRHTGGGRIRGGPCWWREHSGTGSEAARAPPAWRLAEIDRPPRGVEMALSAQFLCQEPASFCPNKQIYHNIKQQDKTIVCPSPWSRSHFWGATLSEGRGAPPPRKSAPGNSG